MDHPVVLVLPMQAMVQTVLKLFTWGNRLHCKPKLVIVAPLLA